MSGLKVLMAASEAVPFAKTGGLADVAGALPGALKSIGADVRIIMPLYGAVDAEAHHLTDTGISFAVTVGPLAVRGKVKRALLNDSIEVLFIENDDYFRREGLYGTPKGDHSDNLERFIFFSKAILEVLKFLDWKPDVIHCHDWQTGLVPAFLKTLCREDLYYRSIRTILTIHNLAYQGLFPKEQFPFLGMGWEEFIPQKLEFYQQFSLLKAGLIYADKLTTVSPTYSREIQTREFGCGFEGVLRMRALDLIGILNGIDYGIWNPENDKKLPVNFGISNPGKRLKVKKHLLSLLGLPADRLEDIPLIGSISRLDEQKGYDIIADALPELMEKDIQFVFLGTGKEKFQAMLSLLAERYPGKVSIQLRFDDNLAHLIYGGTDMFLMPSKYEPCGLGQLIALRYGSVPVVTPTGGLMDTIVDYSGESGDGNGFVIKKYSAEELIAALERGINLYKNRGRWRSLLTRGMKLDFSWEASAEKYMKLYQSPF